MKILNRIKKTPWALISYRTIYNTIGRLFPNYFGHQVYELWFSTLRYKIPSYEQAIINTATQESIFVNGIDVATYCWQHPTKPVEHSLLFIHGWTGRGSQVAHYVEPLTNMGYRVISFDAIAHGITAGKQTSVLELTDTVLAIEKYHGKFHSVLTHSFGGMALAYASTLGLSANKMVMVCPPHNFDVLLQNFNRTLALPESIKKVMSRKSFATHGQVVRDAINTSNNVKKIKAKGLIIHDENDKELPVTGSEIIANNWSGAHLIKTQGLGHRRILREPKVIDMIVDFLKSPENEAGKK